MRKVLTVTSRRDFLKYAGFIAGVGWLNIPIRSIASPVVPVGMAKRGTVGETVRRAVALSGGLDFIKPGTTVLIKPNVNSPDPYPGTTNPDVVHEVVTMVRERDPARIIVADRSRSWDSTLDCMKRTGIYDAAVSTGATVIPFDDTPWIDVTLREASYWGGEYTIPRLVTEADYLINLPVVKTHYIATFTMSLKNFVGIIHPDDRGILHGAFEPVFGGMIAEIGLAVRPSLNIMDGTRVFVSGGPAQGDVVEPGIIMASRDRIAADVTGLALLKTLGTVKAIQERSVWSHPQVVRAVELGLGISDPSSILLRGDGIPEIATIASHLGGGTIETMTHKMPWGAIKATLKDR